jgi:LacI family transcriptional regulator
MPGLFFALPFVCGQNALVLSYKIDVTPCYLSSYMKPATPRSPKPDLIAVAREAGVSTATVSRVLNRSPKVREETRRVVATALRKLNYIPEGNASRTVAIFMEERRGLALDSYSANLLAALTQNLSAQGIPFEVLGIKSIEQIQERSIRAAISLGWSEASARLLATHHPEFTVAINDQVPGCVCIGSDHEAQVALAVEHLTARGHTRIALFTDSLTNWGGRARLRGYIKTAPASTTDAASLTALVKETLAETMVPTLAEVLRHQPTALVVAGEGLALPVWHACATLGVRIPDDLSVITLENPAVSPWLLPAPTTVDPNPAALASAVAESVAAFFNVESVPAESVLPVTLIERHSVKTRS